MNKTILRNRIRENEEHRNKYLKEMADHIKAILIGELTAQEEAESITLLSQNQATVNQIQFNIDFLTKELDK